MEIKEFFNSNNERVRIHYKNEENRKSDYYTDIMASFPDNTKSCQSASEKQMNEKTSNTSQPDLKEIQYSDGIYKGEIVNGKRHGYGIYTWNNGDIYEGDWVDDKRHGHGKQSYHNGRTYTGEWQDDKYSGFGFWCWCMDSKKATYVGEWKGGKNTDMVPSPNSLKLYMMVNGKMVCTMDMVCSNILMELFIMEIGRMVKNMDMVFFPSPTVIVTKENGKMINIVGTTTLNQL